MQVKIAQVVGLNTDQKAAQVISQSREDETFLAVVNLSCDDAFTKGRLSLSELSDFYFETDGNTSEKLNSTFDEAKKRFSDDPDFSLVLGAISGKALYLIGKGDVEVFLKRSGKLSSLLSIGSDAQIISGFLQEGDRLLLSTKSLSNFLGDDLENSLNLPLDSFEEEMSAKVAQHPLPDSGMEEPSDEGKQEEGEVEDEQEKSEEEQGEGEEEIKKESSGDEKIDKEKEEDND